MSVVTSQKCVLFIVIDSRLTGEIFRQEQRFDAGLWQSVTIIVPRLSGTIYD